MGFNDDLIRQGVEGFEAEIQDLTNKLGLAYEEVQEKNRKISGLQRENEDLENQVRQLKNSIETRKQQDNWTKVTGIRNPFDNF